MLIQPIDELDKAIATLASRINQDTHQSLVLVRRFYERDYRDRWFFKRPDGRSVPACGYRADDMVDDDIGKFSVALNNPPRGGSDVSQAFGKVTPV